MASIQIDKLLETVVREKVSDLHITTGQPPVVRLSGRMQRLDTKSLEPEDTAALMKSITPERNQQELQEKGGTDFGFAFGDKARFRVAVFKQRGHIGMVLRRVPNEFLTFEQLGLPPIIAELITRPRGLFLVTGPTGSGKTTSLASMINYINDHEQHHIITLEDPIEYYHQHKKSTINQREIGVDVPSFPEALRRALRMDPDIILVGEMRDQETFETAIHAAETGHLVYGTIHASSAPGTIQRILDLFPQSMHSAIRASMAMNMKAVVGQKLLKTIVEKPSRVPIVEIMLFNATVRKLVQEKQDEKLFAAIQIGKDEGMQVFNDSLYYFVQKELISRAAAFEISPNVEELKMMLKGIKVKAPAIL